MDCNIRVWLRNAGLHRQASARELADKMTASSSSSPYATIYHPLLRRLCPPLWTATRTTEPTTAARWALANHRSKAYSNLTLFYIVTVMLCSTCTVCFYASPCIVDLLLFVNGGQRHYPTVTQLERPPALAKQAYPQAGALFLAPNRRLFAADSPAESKQSASQAAHTPSPKQPVLTLLRVRIRGHPFRI